MRDIEFSLTHASVEEGLGVDGHEVGGDGAHLDPVEIPCPARKCSANTCFENVWLNLEMIEVCTKLNMPYHSTRRKRNM